MLTDAIANCLARHKHVQAGYLFGSVAAGRTRPDSDIDIAVLLDDKIRPSRTLKYRLGIMADLGAALDRSDVDVVVLNEATLLAHRVLSKGKLVFERSACARIRFQVMTANRYADMIPAYETYIRYLKASVREGRIVG